MKLSDKNIDYRNEKEQWYFDIPGIFFAAISMLSLIARSRTYEPHIYIVRYDINICVCVVACKVFFHIRNGKSSSIYMLNYSDIIHRYILVSISLYYYMTQVIKLFSLNRRTTSF